MGMKRPIAVALVLALILGVPGSSFYEASAQVVGAAARAGVVSSVAGAASGVRVELPSLPSSGTGSFSLSGGVSVLPVGPAGVSAEVRPVASGATVVVSPAASSAKTVTVPAASAVVAIPAAALVWSKSAAPSVTKSADEQAVEAGRIFDFTVRRTETESFSPVIGAESFGATRFAAAGNAAPEPGKNETPAPAAKNKLPRSLWGLFWGHHIFTVFGVNFHMLSQPFLVKDALGMGTATMGLVRNIHMGAMAIVNFLPIGYLIDKTDVRVVYITTSLARAALMAAIPLLFMSGGLSFTALALIVAVNPLFQSTMIVADAAGRKAFLGSDEKLNKDAAATIGKWDAVAGMLMPLVAGWVIGALVTSLGLGGYAVAYGIYAGFLLLSIPFYWKMVRDPRMPDGGNLSAREIATQMATFAGALVASFFSPALLVLRWSYARFFPGERAAFPIPFGAKSAREALSKAWASAKWLGAEGGRLLVGALLLPLTVPAALWRAGAALLRFARAPRTGTGKGMEGVYESAASALDKFVPMEGLAFILRNKVLRVLTMVMAVEVFLIDALPFVLLPNLITDAFGAFPTSLPSWMPEFLSGPILTQVATAGGVLGLLFSVEYIGRFLSSARLESEKGDRLIEKWGHGRFYKMAAIASLAFWLLYLVPMVLAPGAFWINLAVTAAVLFTVQLFHAPVGIVMEPVKRKQMPDDKLARIESAVFMVDVAFESIGALILGLTLDIFGIKAALIATGVALTLTAILQWKVPAWINLPGPKAKKNDEQASVNERDSPFRYAFA